MDKIIRYLVFAVIAYVMAMFMIGADDRTQVLSMIAGVAYAVVFGMTYMFRDRNAEASHLRTAFIAFMVTFAILALFWWMTAHSLEGLRRGPKDLGWGQ